MQKRAAVGTALLGGTTAMREAGQLYLPQEPAESPEAWTARLLRTVLFPAYEKTINTMVGKPFGAPIELGEDVPRQIQDACENIDLTGRDLETWASDVFRQTLSDGIGWAVVDYPQVPTGATLADERVLGVRPYLIHVPLANVLGWRSKIIQGVHKLTQFRYLEITEAEDGLFGTKEVKRVRILEKGQVTVYTQNDKKEWMLDPELSSTVTLQEIPVVTFYTGRKGWNIAEPPLENLAWLNVEHYQSRSDQRHILHFARVPMLFAKNLGEGNGKIVIGANRLVQGGPDSDLKIVEHSGNAISAGRQDLLDIEDAMRRVAGELLSGKVQKTATETDLESFEGESQLKRWVRTFEDALEECFRLMASWLKLPSGGGISIDTDWNDASLQADMITALTNLRSTGNMSQESLIWNLQQGGLLPPGREVEEEKALLNAEGPTSMGDPFASASLSARDRLKADAKVS